jgi:predicted TIM-barrel fold metal-dependent hydrolase
MGVIDMFVHPVAHASEADLFDLSNLDWDRWIQETLATMDRCGVSASGVCVMDDRILDRSADLKALAEADASGRLWFTFMPDIRRADVARHVEAAAAAGFRGLSFHSYLQQITPEDYAAVVNLCQQAEQLGLFSGLCTAYGSKRMFDYHSLPLAAKVAEQVRGPVLLYHNGGARVLEAMLMCEMWPNLYLETSFSLTYWLGSSVETDLAFAIRKIGARRVMFGSDAPFLPADKALNDHALFFERHGFSPEDRELILGGSARALFPFLPKS